MATYNAPLEDLTIFDSSVFHAVHADVDSATLDTLYLKYPVAQGAEFIPSLTVGTGCGIGGNLGVGGNISLTNSPTANITAPNNISMTSTTGNIDFTTTIAGTGIGFNTGIVDLVCDRLVNTGSYNQGVQNNLAGNPTLISFNVGCMICSTAGNDIQTLPYTQYSNGFIFSAVNLTAGVINLISQDINIYSWLRGNVATIYPIQPNSSITCELLPDFLTLGASIWFVRDDFGYKTVNTTANITHYLNFSDASTSGVGNIQKTAGISCNPNTNTITATTFSGSATGVLTTSDNSNGTYFIPFSKTTSGANTSLYLDDTTGPFTYNPSNGGLTFLIGVCPRYDSSSNSANCSLFGNTTTGSITIGNSQTTGSMGIGNNLSSGNINIGNPGVMTGVVNMRPILVLSRQLRTSILAPTNALDLGVEVVYNASGFANTSLTSNIVANLIAESFTSAKFGTYLFTAQVKINPTATGATRQIQISISTQTGVIQTPYYVETHSFVGGTVGTLFITRTLQIYANTSVTLTALCAGSNANVEAVGNDGLFSYVRIA